MDNSMTDSEKTFQSELLQQYPDKVVSKVSFKQFKRGLDFVCTVYYVRIENQTNLINNFACGPNSYIPQPFNNVVGKTEFDNGRVIYTIGITN